MVVPGGRLMIDARWSSKPVVKSLLQKILPASPYSSIFWRDQSRSLSGKSLRINILGKHAEKNERGRSTTFAGPQL
jgi:hypothetical protein